MKRFPWFPSFQMVRHLQSEGFAFSTNSSCFYISVNSLYVASFFVPGTEFYTLQSMQYIWHIYYRHPNACIYGCFHKGLKWRSSLNCLSGGLGGRSFWCLVVTRILDDRTVFLNIFALCFLFTRVDSNHFTDKVKDNELHYDWESEYRHSLKQHLGQLSALVWLGRPSF